MTLWSSDAEADPTEKLLEFTGSLELDQRLYPYDIRGSIAWAKALEQAGIYNPEEFSRVEETLEEIEAELDSGEFELDPELEDIHMNIEAELSQRLPELGPRLHTGRSRNDQILVDVKLYLKDAVREIREELGDLLATLLKRGRAEESVHLPGFTHLQPAQPVTLTHYLLSFFEKFRRDFERLEDCTQSLNVLPLGSGALAGSGFDIDREFLCDELGFEKLSRNSIDTVSERDFMVDLLNALVLISLHASRLCEDWIIWSSPEFGFCRLRNELTTGSSIMPQKKNPDVLELIRGQAGRISGAYQGLTEVLKGQPLAYNRDLQEDKFHMFTALDSVKTWLPLLTEAVRSVNFYYDAMEASARDNYLAATDLADYLTEQGLAFREAHNVVRELVEVARDNGCRLEELGLEQFREVNDQFTEAVYDILEPEASVKRREISGGTGPGKVEEALVEAEKWLKEKKSNDN